MTYIIVLKTPFIENVSNFNENKSVTKFESVDELNVKMVN